MEGAARAVQDIAWQGLSYLRHSDQQLQQFPAHRTRSLPLSSNVDIILFYINHLPPINSLCETNV